MRFLLPVFALVFLSLPVSAQDNKLKDVSDGADTTAGDKKDSKIALKLTDAERKQLEPLQQAVIETNQELSAAAEVLYKAKGEAVLAAAYRWQAAAVRLDFALTNRSNWIATTAKAKGCDGCELNLQTMELQRAQAKP